jgi:hypothetical protein
MNAAQPQPNNILQKDNESANAPVTPAEPLPVRTASSQTDSAVQTAPTRQRLSFWEAAYHWIMARP